LPQWHNARCNPITLLSQASVVPESPMTLWDHPRAAGAAQRQTSKQESRGGSIRANLSGTWSRREALTEIDAFFRKSGRIIIPLTVREILDEQIAKKLA
jgi:hypothetical protein